jgi:hypothetical protein
MFKFNRKLSLVLSSVGALIVSGSALAENVTGNATVTIKNALAISEDQQLSFGTLAASGDGAAGVTATYQVNVDGSTTITAATPTTANIIEIVSGSAAVFSVAGAAPQTLLVVSNPPNFKLTDPSGTEPMDFDVSGLVAEVITGDNAFDLTTDAGGNLVFGFPAELATDTDYTGGAVGAPYRDTVYTGSYSFTVNY